MKLKSGEIIPSDTIGNLIYYTIRFDKVKGGDSMLFGSIKVKESHGYKAERLVVLENNNVISKLSINEITHSLQTLEDIDLGEFIK